MLLCVCVDLEYYFIIGHLTHTSHNQVPKEYDFNVTEIQYAPTAGKLCRLASGPSFCQNRSSYRFRHPVASKLMSVEKPSLFSDPV